MSTVMEGTATMGAPTLSTAAQNGTVSKHKRPRHEGESFGVPVEIGDEVHYFRDAQVRDTPVAAIVTRINDETLDLTLIVKDAATLVPVSGVRHASDPRIEMPEIRKLGCWDHKPRTRKLLALLHDLGAK